jgi:hypothetical protein
MRNIYRSKLSKRDAPGGLFFFMLTSEENTAEGENIPFKKSSSWRRERKRKCKFNEIFSRFYDFTVGFFFMLTSEHKRKIQWIKGGNISLQKFFS